MYLNPERNGIARVQFVKHISRLSVPAVVLTPVPTTTIAVASGTWQRIARIWPSIYNPFPDIVGLDYPINNFTLYETQYAKYRLRGFKVTAEVIIQASGGGSLGNIYLFVNNLNATDPTRMEDTMVYKHIARKPYVISSGEPAKRYKISLYMTTNKYLERRYDPSMDDRSPRDDGASAGVDGNNWFQFILAMDNNGIAGNVVRANFVITYWVQWKKANPFDFTN